MCMQADVRQISCTAVSRKLYLLNYPYICCVGYLRKQQPAISPMLRHRRLAPPLVSVTFSTSHASRLKRSVCERTAEADSTHSCGLNDAKNIVCSTQPSGSTSITDVTSGRSSVPCLVTTVSLLMLLAVFLVVIIVTFSRSKTMSGSLTAVKLSRDANMLSTDWMPSRMTGPTFRSRQNKVSTITEPRMFSDNHLVGNFFNYM